MKWVDDVASKMHVHRGLFRVWIVISALWVMSRIPEIVKTAKQRHEFYAGNDPMDDARRLGESAPDIYDPLLSLLTLPVILLLAYYLVAWLWSGFRKAEN